MPYLVCILYTVRSPSFIILTGKICLRKFINGSPWTGSTGVVHGPGPRGGPWTWVHVFYTSIWQQKWSFLPGNDLCMGDDISLGDLRDVLLINRDNTCNMAGQHANQLA